MGGSDAEGDGLRRRGGGGVVQISVGGGGDAAAATTPFVAAVDVGTSMLKCFIFDASARVVGKSSSPISVLRPAPNRAEIEPEALWRQFQSVFQEAVDDAQISPSDVTSLGISTLRNSFTTWDADSGKPYHNFILWTDNRAADLAQTCNESYLFRSFQWIAYFAYLLTRRRKLLFASNLDFDFRLASVRLKWIIDRCPELASGISDGKARFGCIDTFLLWKLSGGKAHLTDFSNVCVTGLFDSFNLDYSSQILYFLGIPRSILPGFCDTSGRLFLSEPEALGAAIPVTAVVGDQQAATFGQFAFEPGAVKATFGTGSFIDVNTGDRALATKDGLYPVIGWKIGADVVYLAEGAAFETATALKWATGAGLLDSPEASADVAASVDDAGGVCFVPAFSGLQAPVKDPKACTAFFGVTVKTTKAHIVRALLEALAFKFYHIYVAALEEEEVDTSNLSSIPVDGGVSRNDFVMQLIADLTGKTLEFPAFDESTALGAAFLSGLAAGVWKDTAELRSLSSTRRLLQPRDEPFRVRARGDYDRWVKAVDRCRLWFD